MSINFALILRVIKERLFAAVPEDQQASYEKHRYHHNLLRFGLQYALLLGLDLLSLAFYSSYYTRQGQSSSLHIAVHIAKIAAMGGLIFLCVVLYRRPFNPAKLLMRNMDMLLSCAFIAMEFALFACGPQDSGALIRLLLTPVLLCANPLIPQKKSTLLMGIVFLLYSSYFALFSVYAATALSFGLMIHLCLMVFPAVLFLSFSSYSASVRQFLSSVREEQARGELSRLNARLDYIARRDQLTKLSNRRDLKMYMESTWKVQGQGYQTASIIMIDLDYFKRYNDRFGTVKGDECLVRVTRAIKDEVDYGDLMLARYGGEEFIIIAYDQPHDELLDLVKRIRIRVEELKIENPDSDVNPYMTACIGLVTMALKDAGDYGELIEWAEECLYRAKQLGRNRVVHSREPYQYLDETGHVLGQDGRRAKSLTALDREQILSAMQQTAADCTLLYYRSLDRVEFSAGSVRLMGMPRFISSPSIQKVVDYMGISVEDRHLFAQELERVLKAREPFFSIEARFQTREQPEAWYAVRAQCIYAEDGSLDALFGTIYAIQNMLQYNRYLQMQSMTNNITLLPNRQKLYTDLEEMKDKDRPLGGYLVLLDIANFKAVNGMYSHNIGDKILRETAKMLVNTVSADGMVYSYAVDQFIVLAQDLSQQQAQDLLERTQHFFALNHVEAEGIRVRVSFMMAAVAIPPSFSSPDDLMVDLDITMQKVKFSGKQSYGFYSPEDREEYLTSVTMRNTLAKDIEDDFRGFLLYYQPIMDAKTGLCVGAEALFRWRAPDGGLVPPLTIIPILEQAKLMPVVEQWLFRTACGQCGAWIDEGVGGDFFVQVNVSALYVARPSLLDEVRAAAGASGIGLNNMLIEVTETATMAEVAKSIGTLRQLREQGIRIAIDDFGTGYSSLSYLRDLPANEIKIDRSFLTGIDQDASVKAFLQAIVDLSKSMGFMVCLEGVETAEQNDAVQDLGADYLQGYFYGRPLPPDAFYKSFLKKDSDQMS